MSGKLIVSGAEITVTTIDDKDYISLTDMLKAKDGDFFISDCVFGKMKSVRKGAKKLAAGQG